jgi:pyruvate kinase
MSKTKKTKIVATLGPAINNRERLKELMISGVNVFRINFSHADYEEVRKIVKIIRSLNEEMGYHVACLADLQGPKLRVGVMEEGVELRSGEPFVFTTEPLEIGTREKAFMTYQNFPKDVKVGEQILVDDGKLLFKVTATDGVSNVTTEVLRGGPLKSKKGVNLPNTAISLPALTEKDVKDAIFALSLEVDWIALSFVRNPKDLEDIHQLIQAHSDTSEYRTRVISKIEKPEAIQNIDAIIANTDGLMVARGDLGVEIPMAEVPLVQKMLVRKAKEAKIPVIIATQMMESMIDCQVPTRAEVNDVANSIMDGADAVMLSGETSVGAFPNEVIKKMREIIISVEHSPLIQVPRKAPTINDPERYISDVVCHQAALLADNIKARVISTLTNSGYTAFQISAWRPKSHIYVYSPNKRVLAMLNLYWGVKATYYNNNVSTHKTIEQVNALAAKRGVLKKGDFIVNLNSTPVKKRGKVNTLRVTQVE